jgi:hypothetical protein
MKESGANCNALQIIGCFRHADDILIIYDEIKTSIDKTLAEFNEKQLTIKCDIAKESHNSINF